ncbi:MAG: hypothetical protein GXY01_03095 [Clostridiales bacterium]|nr:hypothetical protein [Clostridiales bacterium]
MRKSFCIIIAVIIFTLLCSCEKAEPTLASSVPSPDSSGEHQGQDPLSSPDISGEDLESSPNQSDKPALSADNKERADIFRTFLSENYQKLSDAIFGGIAGIGFIDLDMDGGIEMLIFDAGASAAMGVQFFDIIDDKVECVSANMDSIGEAFGGDHMTDVIVNANYCDDFRLMENKSTGEKFYIVESKNGASDFSYTELIRFGSDNGILTLKSLMYKHEDYDLESGNVKAQNFKISGKKAGKSEYETEYNNFYSALKDTGYDARGVFMWENTNYKANYEGLIAIFEKALTLYDGQTNS